MAYEDGDPPLSLHLLRPISESPLRLDPLSRSFPSAAHRRASSTSHPSHDIHLPTPAVRHGSRAESERLASSQPELADADARLVFVGDPGRTDPHLQLAGNAIRTAKYSPLTFLPRNLFEQFHRVAYIYFLVIAVLNQLPQLAVFGRGASVLPLAFVLLVTAVKDAYEDWRRHRSDRIENNRVASVVDPRDGQFRPKRWKDVRVGEVLKVFADETNPCDMVLLATSDPTGVAYVQTINLDGESNLKTRYANHETTSRPIGDAHPFAAGLICCEQPNRNIYGFLANMEIDGKRVSLGPSNIILRGCELKNTAWAIGVAVYAGSETKVMLNSTGAPSKRSRLETHMNRETLLLSAVLITLCSVVSICNGIWLGKHRNDLELSQFFRKRDYSDSDKNYNYYGIGMQVFFTFLMSVIVFQIMIPISLYISMELVRLGQAYFMIRDTNLYDESSNSKFQCRALNINEDLGQIKYVFSDKTGTLTENKMEFQCASIRGRDYGSGKVPLQDNGGTHSVLGRVIWKPKMSVKTDPELVALLQSRVETEQGNQAREFFLALACCNTIVPLIVETTDQKQKLIDYQGESPDEQALVFAAASYGFVLIERTSGHIVVDVLGVRQRYDVLGLHEFDSDRKRMSVIIGCADKTVKLYVKGADISMFGVIHKTIDLDIIRATETSLIAYSSLGLRTLVVGMRKLSRNDFEEWRSAYENASTLLIGRGRLLRAVSSNVERDLQILGASGIEDKLQQGVPEAIESMRQAGIKVWVLTGDKQETAISIGFSLATVCDVVLCCRVAPLQKAGIVALMKNRTDNMTLAIGDAQKSSQMKTEIGMKVMVLTLQVNLLPRYVLYTAYSLTTAISEWSSVLYSVIYTALPTIIVGTLDKDLSRRTLIKYPQLYRAGQRDERYNLKFFILTMMDSIWQSLAIFYIPYLAYRHSVVDGSSLGDLWTLAVVILVNIHLAMDVFRWNWITHASIWGCIVATVISVIIIDSIWMLPGYWYALFL
ncbi:hypothetical protein BHE74_00031673 [Ensete ventricosum]|nr:hypothetical protein BHE74_00031673 [Ensete ventricosum]RZS17505.1 hypothetical protein BHM03_00049653 [Ensete ventricosum]